MTHAALKDLLPCPCCNGQAALKTLTRDREGWATAAVVCSVCGMQSAPFTFSADDSVDRRAEKSPVAVIAWNSRAALSAMEGEAVAFLVTMPSGKVRGYYDDKLTAIALSMPNDTITNLYTAPPPQQAADRSWLLELVPEAQAFNDGMEDREWCAGFNSCRRMTLGNIERSALATHPTPSPGPQGGGAIWTSDPMEALRRIEAMGGPAGYTARECLRRATPPAHQPGEVVTDAMVERAAKAMCADDHDVDGSTERWWADEIARNEYIRYARINLTAALAPKEAGHE